MQKTDLENQMCLRDLGETHGELLVILSVLIHLLSCLLDCSLWRPQSALPLVSTSGPHLVALDAVPEWGDVGTVEQEV